MSKRIGALLAVCVGVFLIASVELIHAQDQDEVDEATELLKEGLPLTPERTLSETFNEGSWISLDVSPDGQTIAFDFLGDLYTMPLSGGEAVPLTQGMAFDGQPRFSPDGETVVFVSDRSGGDGGVWKRLQIRIWQTCCTIFEKYVAAKVMEYKKLTIDRFLFALMRFQKGLLSHLSF